MAKKATPSDNPRQSVLKKTKAGTLTNKSEYNQLRQDLKAASRPNVKRKPSLPKLPWDDKEETE